MEESSKTKKRKKKINEVKTFSVPYAIAAINENVSISTNASLQNSKEHIFNQALKLHSKGNILEAAKCYKNLIDQVYADKEKHLGIAKEIKCLNIYEG